VNRAQKLNIVEVVTGHLQKFLQETFQRCFEADARV